jgi:hypothetical protein
MMGALVANAGSMVGTGGTLMEYTVGEADGNADGSTPGITLMICPCTTNANDDDDDDDCRPNSSDHINKQ